MCVVCLCVVCVCSFMNYLWYMVAYRLTKVGNPTVGFPVGKHTMTYVSFPLPPPFPPTSPYSPPYIVWQSVVILQIYFATSEKLVMVLHSAVLIRDISNGHFTRLIWFVGR